MGRQINFYMLPEDEEEFVAYVLSQKKDILMVVGHSETASPKIIENLPATFSEGNWNPIYFWDRNVNGELKAEYIKTQGYFLVDSSASPVVEFIRCFVQDNLLLRGRIWAEIKYWNGDKSIYKGKEFENWFNALARWIRRNYQKISKVEYLAPRAAEWHRRGGMLKGALYKGEDG